MPLIRRAATAPVTPPLTSAATDAATAIGALRGGAPPERWAAARALAAHPGAVPALSDALDAEADDRVREAIFTSLVRINTADSLDALLDILRRDDASLRNGALDALKAMPEQVQVRLHALLHDTDVDVRILACDLARDVPSDETASSLARLLQTEPVLNVCIAAIDTLAEIGSPETLPALAACLDRFPDQPFLRFAVTAAGGRISAAPVRPAGPLPHDG